MSNVRSIKKYVLTDGNGFYIYEKQLGGVQQTTSFELATNYRFKAFRHFSKKAAEDKYKKKYEFKNQIVVSSWDISIKEDLDAMGDAPASPTSKVRLSDFILYILFLSSFIGMINEQGFFTAVFIALIFIRLYTK